MMVSVAPKVTIDSYYVFCKIHFLTWIFITMNMINDKIKWLVMISIYSHNNFVREERKLRQLYQLYLTKY